jgi:hypothetical protein
MTSSGSTIIASLLEGIIEYVAIRRHRSVVELLRRAQGLRVIITFVDLLLLALISLFSLGCVLVLFARSRSYIMWLLY